MQNLESLHSISDLVSLIKESRVYSPFKPLLCDYVHSYGRKALGFQHLDFMLGFQRHLLPFDLNLRRFFHDFINQISVLVMIEMNNKEKLKYTNLICKFIDEYDLGTSQDAAKLKVVIHNSWEQCFQKDQILWICDAIDMYNELVNAVVQQKFCVIK